MPGKSGPMKRNAGKGRVTKNTVYNRKIKKEKPLPPLDKLEEVIAYRNETRKKSTARKAPPKDCLFPHVNGNNGVYYYGDYNSYKALFEEEVEAVPNPFSFQGFKDFIFGSNPAVKESNICRLPLCVDAKSKIIRILHTLPHTGEKVSYILKGKTNYKEMSNHMCITTLQRHYGIKIIPDFICGKASAGAGHEDMFLMEDLGGVNLREYINTNRDTITEKERLELSNILKRRVSELHSLGYIHMDLKPDNFIITPDNNIYIIDLESAGKVGSFYDKSIPETDGFSLFHNTLQSLAKENPNKMNGTKSNIIRAYYTIMNEQYPILQRELNQYSLEKTLNVLSLPP